MSDINSDKVSMPVFKGSRDDFFTWWTRFQAYAMLKHFRQALKPEAETNLPATEETATGETPANESARKRNNLAIYYLTLAFQNEALLNLVYKSCTQDWPSGLAWKIVEALFIKYKPDDTISRVEMRGLLANVSMKKDEDPSTLFEQLSVIENRYNTRATATTAARTIDEEDLIATVIQKAPFVYQSVITNEHRTKGTNLKLTDLEEVMHQFYRQVAKTDGTNNNKGAGTEVNFTNVGGTSNTNTNNNNSGNSNTSNKNGKKKSYGKKGTKKGKCKGCGKEGHWWNECWDNPQNADTVPKWYKPKAKTNAESNNSEANMSAAATVRTNNTSGNEVFFCSAVGTQVFPDDLKILSDPNIFLADSGATAHMTNCDIAMVDIKPVNKTDHALCANGGISKVTKIGCIPAMKVNNQGLDEFPLRLMDVSHTPDSPFNVVSITKMLMENWILTGNKDEMTLVKGDKQIHFDIKIHTPKGVLYAAYLKRMEHSETGLVAARPEPKQINIQAAHAKFGHMGEDETRKAAAANGFKIVRGTLGPCEACTIGKAKQKNIPKATKLDQRGNTDRLYLDCTTLKSSNNKSAAKSTWRIMVKGSTGFKTSDFFETKDGMVEPTCESIQKMITEKRMPPILRMDNAGENVKLEARMSSSAWKFPTKVEYTARNTPQQNSPAEVGLATIAMRARAMMSAAHIPDKIKHLLMPEACKTATKLDGLVLVTHKNKTATRYFHEFKEHPAFAKHLRTFGEAGTVTLKSNMMAKPVDRGAVCVFVGYADLHDGDCYRMWNPRTKRIHQTRDVIWLRRMYYPAVNTAPIVDIEAGEDETTLETADETLEEAINNEPEEDEAEQPTTADDDEVLETTEEAGSNETTTPTTTRSGRVSVPTKNLHSGDYELNMVVSRFYDKMEKCTDIQEFYMAGVNLENGYVDPSHETSMLGAGTGGGFVNTQELHVMKYEDALKSKDADKWLKAIEEEHDRMVEKGVFEVVPRKDVPAGSKIMTNTWAMKKKSNGTYRARTNARGFEQVDGKHYDSKDTAAPVVTEITIRVVLVLIIMAGMYAELLDVHGAFLLGDFDPKHKMYMELPKGFEKWYPSNCVLLLLKTIYGVKQAAKQFWKLLVSAFDNIDCIRNKADPCLHYKWTAKGLVIWMSWVDDCLLCGPETSALMSKSQFLELFDCDETGGLEEYVGCKIDRNMEERSMRLTQPVLLQSYVDEFELTGSIPEVPAPAGSMLSSDDQSPDLSPEQQTKYRSGVGKLLHMMRWSRPDILNRVRELSRFMQAAKQSHFHAMITVMKYCVNTPKRGLELKPNATWDGINKEFPFVIHGLSDSNYATDADSRRSTTGSTTFLCGAPVAMKSKTQQCVTLSVTEAEFVAGTECVQDMLFTKSLLESMGLKVDLPMQLYIDNQGAVDLVNSWSATGRTRHVAVRIAFLRELKEQGILEVNWIPSAFMSSDIFTKNVGKADFVKHVKVYCGEDDYG